ncbi:hypothetical protein O3S80_03145 [Streptomyces sp. Lzd4kr]|nr:hypothetical protein [Streptomyces sp. Lzd4kr]
MTTPAPEQTSDALSPVRAELLRAAHSEAETLLARAERDAAARVDEARVEARSILDAARRQGEADGADAARDLLVGARREARSRTLSARREAYEELRREAAERMQEVRRTDEYPPLRQRLEHRVRVLLGPGVGMTEHADGGVVAEASGRRVDLSLPALADRALDRMGGEARNLWEP